MRIGVCEAAPEMEPGGDDWQRPTARAREGQADGGCGWIFDPAGDLVAETSADHPVVTVELDPARVRSAQREYPCYVSDLPAPANPWFDRP